MKLEIRSASDQDVPDLVDLTLRAFIPIFESFPKILGAEIYRRIWPDWRACQAGAVEAFCEAHEEHTVLVADVDGNAVGFVVYDLDDKTKTGTVQLIAVHPGYQNRGIGTGLSEAAAKEMSERGMTLAQVETGGDVSHAPARRAYEKAGYTGLPLVRYFKTLKD